MIKLAGQISDLETKIVGTNMHGSPVYKHKFNIGKVIVENQFLSFSKLRKFNHKNGKYVFFIKNIFCGPIWMLVDKLKESISRM